MSNLTNEPMNGPIHKPIYDKSIREISTGVKESFQNMNSIQSMIDNQNFFHYGVFLIVLALLFLLIVNILEL